MPNFGTNMMLRILLDAYFREHSIYVMIVMSNDRDIHKRRANREKKSRTSPISVLNYRAGAVIRNLRVLSWPLFRTSIQFVVANSLSYFGVFSEIQTVKKAYFVS